MSIERVLIAGNELTQAVAKVLLEAKGCLVLGVSDMAGLTATMGAGKNFEMALLDLSMPGLNISEFILRMKRRSPQAAVVGLGVSDHLTELLSQGLFDLLPLPLTESALNILFHRASRQHLIQSELNFYRATAIDSSEEMIGRSEKIREVFTRIDKLVALNAPLLITGEPGTGKDLLARLIHRRCFGSNAPYIRIACSAYAGSSLEKELFGSVAGSSSGRAALVDIARGGSLVLEEISEAPPSVQTRLLTLLQTLSPQAPRLICMTTRNLSHEVEHSQFNAELFQLLNANTLTLPALRDRQGDAVLIADYFLRRYATIAERSLLVLDSSARECIANYNWPLNARELKYAIERAIVLEGADKITAQALNILPMNLAGAVSGFTPMTRSMAPSTTTRVAAATTATAAVTVAPDPDIITVRVGQQLGEIEKQIIRRTVEAMRGNRTKAAQVLGISVRTLYTKLLEIDEQEKNATVPTTPATSSASPELQ
jgi:DNA-binding NtrC family response regulator